MNGPQMDTARLISKNGESHLNCIHKQYNVSPNRRIKTAVLLAACVNAVSVQSVLESE